MLLKFSSTRRAGTRDYVKKEEELRYKSHI
jgi:hypothetical protein